jgi:hypothetical protein
MTDRKLNIYSIIIIDRRFASISPHHKQAPVVVACESQKRAAELFGVSVSHFQQYGGVGAQKHVEDFCRSHPGVVFVECGQDVYSTLEDAEDESKRVTLEGRRDADVYGRDNKHPAFGMINVSRVQGECSLFGVDYPQGHWVEIEISTATLTRANANDYYHADKSCIRIAMSEVQYARMIASANTMGVACTLNRYRDPTTGEFMAPRLPDRHAASEETFRAEVERKAQLATEGVKAARERLNEILKGPLRKGDLTEVSDLLRAAEGQMGANLPYVVERAHETIQTATEHAKAEVDAHIDYSMARLGERALGARLAQALEAGADLTIIGRNVSAALDESAVDRQEEISPD